MGIVSDKGHYDILDIEDFGEGVWELKPYLRPMLSMTEEEKEEYNKTENLSLFDLHHYPTIKSFDWLNAHHFDYRGLIEKGLALEAPEGMYKNK